LTSSIKGCSVGEAGDTGLLKKGSL